MDMGPIRSLHSRPGFQTSHRRSYETKMAYRLIAQGANTLFSRPVISALGATGNGGIMKMGCLCLFASLAILPLDIAAQQPAGKPGLLPYTPTRVEWLALWSNAELRRDFTPESQFTLSVLNSDHETVLIYVRYIPTVNRQAMNMAIDNARDVI